MPTSHIEIDNKEIRIISTRTNCKHKIEEYETRYYIIISCKKCRILFVRRK